MTGHQSLTRPRDGLDQHLAVTARYRVRGEQYTAHFWGYLLLDKQGYPLAIILILVSGSVSLDARGLGCLPALLNGRLKSRPTPNVQDGFVLPGKRGPR